jgi:predicted PurR-regulated permease PerM
VLTKNVTVMLLIVLAEAAILYFGPDITYQMRQLASSLPFPYLKRQTTLLQLLAFLR